MNTSNNHLVPEIFDNSAWEDKIVLLQFVKIHNESISVIAMDQDVLRTIEATDPANLKPFKEWKITGSGNIQFTTESPRATAHRGKFYNPHNPHNPSQNYNHNPNTAIYPPAMKMIADRAESGSFRDIRMAQANDRD